VSANGCQGLSRAQIAIAREIGSSRELLHEDSVRNDDTSGVIAKIAASHRTAIVDTAKVLDPAKVDRAVTLLRNARRAEIYGIGTAAPIAEDAAYRLLRLGLDVKAMTDSHSQAVSAALTGPDVATLTISHSGRTRETLLATKLAKAAGAHTICITNFGKPPLLKYCDVALFTAAVETRYRDGEPRRAAGRHRHYLCVPRAAPLGAFARLHQAVLCHPVGEAA
jgi:RpiR family transcriptional regulator, carbohydrate utilization regulator